MARSNFAWSEDKRKKINMRKVRNLSIGVSNNECFVTAWWSDKESVEIGRFSAVSRAQAFIDEITSGVKVED